MQYQNRYWKFAGHAFGMARWMGKTVDNMGLTRISAEPGQMPCLLFPGTSYNGWLHCHEICTPELKF